MNKRANPVLWLVVALPLLAVAGSLASLALAVARGDPELPKDYHWEGAGLDRDQQRLALAARQGIGATVGFDASGRAGGHCTVTLQGAAPASLRLSLVHPSDPRADVRLDLARDGSGAGYAAACAPLSAAHWRLELADDQGRWLLRGRTQGALSPPVRLGAPVPRPGGTVSQAGA